MGASNFKRTDRVAAELRREIGLLVHQAVRDGELPEISVSDVEVTRDFAHATVWFTALDSNTAQPAEAMLKQIAWELRMRLSRRLRLRTTPELKFKYDQSIDQGERIERLLRESGSRDPDAGTRDPEPGTAEEQDPAS